jgi:subtilisin family serine protease
LGVRRLHEEGITGRGVRIAIIDQRLLVGHQEYADRLRFYEEIDVPSRSGPQMHGAGVASIALGKTVGVAPEAELYYVARPGGSLLQQARCIHRIIEVNAQLPKENKIRVISMSTGWGPSGEGYEDIAEAVQKARAAGMLVVCTSVEQVHEGFDFDALDRSPLADPDVFESFEPGLFRARDFWSHPSSPSGMCFSVPMASRTTAGSEGVTEYVFYRIGGYSWAVPYIAGVYALAVQADPTITPERFWALAVRTGRTTEVKRGGRTKPLGPIIDPVRLIRAIQAGETATLNR